VELPAPLVVSASSLRAAVTTRYGLPDVVEVREVPTPTPADNEMPDRKRLLLRQLLRFPHPFVRTDAFLP
jgi:hypothetical protein